MTSLYGPDDVIMMRSNGQKVANGAKVFDAESVSSIEIKQHKISLFIFTIFRKI